jgi:hypothetical protein
VELHEQIEGVRTRADLARFVEALERDLADAPGEWENPTLPRFLGAMARWLQDVSRPDDVTPADVAELLYAARGYE